MVIFFAQLYSRFFPIKLNCVKKEEECLMQNLNDEEGGKEFGPVLEN